VADSRHLLEQTALASPDAIAIYNLKEEQPLYLNNCLAEWIGTTNDELISRGMKGRLQLIHPDDREGLLRFNKELSGAADGKILMLEYRIKTTGDNILWVRNRSKVFQRDSAGKVTHILSVLQDVTEEKKGEEELKKLNKTLLQNYRELEEKNREITSFAFVASHDLKEPLRKIHTYSHWIMEKEKDNLSPKGQLYLQKMRAAVNRFDALIEAVVELMNMSKPIKGWETLSLDKVVASAIKELEGSIAASGAVIEYGNLPRVKGEKTQLAYLFINLLENAFKFSREGAPPYIRIEQVNEPGKEKEAGFTHIQVKDNGIGFDPAYKDKIFGLFQRLHHTVYPGTGAGLAICQKIMNNHMGLIRADGMPGTGSTFTLSFPVT
jgi:PAS domain S-box-containing protein